MQADNKTYPFSLVPSRGIHTLLQTIGCSIALSTYKAGKVILIGCGNQGLSQLPRTFDKPMGMAVNGERMAVATRDQIVVLGSSPLLAVDYPKGPGKYDTLWVPRATYFCGEVDAHDMAWGDEGLWAVNTRFSSLCLINDGYSFVPRWQPPFVTDLVPDDRCHLNGLALENGRPAYVTMLGRSNEEKGWRPHKADGGLLMDVESNEVVTEGLSMPHSPRLVEGRLLVMNSGTGEVLEVDRHTGKTETITRLPGFLRGCSVFGQYLFVGLSKLRDQRIFGGLPLEEMNTPLQSGVAVVDMRSGNLVESLFYQNTVDEIYDVHVLPGMKMPGIIGLDERTQPDSLATPDRAFWATQGPQQQPPGERFDDYDQDMSGWK